VTVTVLFTYIMTHPSLQTSYPTHIWGKKAWQSGFIPCTAPTGEVGHDVGKQYSHIFPYFWKGTFWQQKRETLYIHYPTWNSIFRPKKSEKEPL